MADLIKPGMANVANKYKDFAGMQSGVKGYTDAATQNGGAYNGYEVARPVSSGGSGGGSYRPTTTTSTTTSTTNSSGGSTSKTWYSGQVNANTQDKYNQYSKDYQQSDKVTAAYQALQQTLDNRPKDFSSQYAGQLQSLYDQIVNRPGFSYNQADDVMYGLYADRFTQAGNTAMQDVMGQMSGATGGYASSAAQTAGQQAYQGYMDELNNTGISLYEKAYQRYLNEGNMLTDKFNLTYNLYTDEYGQYRDQVSDWQKDRDYAQSAYQTERDFDYNKWASDRNYWTDEYWREKMSETTTEENWWSTSTTVSSTVVTTS